MNYVTCGYEPRRALEIFEELCAIPHGSGNERGIADYIAAFADKNGLFCLRDETGNVFVRKNASLGFEDHGAILLQGHMDMVCEKNADSDHDFERDGLDLRVIDGYLWANGTTLGADNGIAVAMMLALLETDEHPALECLFTVEEETGLAGAKGFDCSPVTAKIMINLDSEGDGQVIAAEHILQKYRKELNDWGELPQADTGNIVKKNKAIDQLVAETTELKRERDVLTAELTISKDHVVKYKRLATDIEANLRMTRSMVARLKNALARHTSAVAVEKIMEDQYKINAGEFGSVASVSEIQKEVKAIKKADVPKYSAKEIADREQAYKTAMAKGETAEKEKNYADALIHYWKATEFKPDSAEVQKSLARVYLIRRDFANARDHYRNLSGVLTDL